MIDGGRDGKRRAGHASAAGGWAGIPAEVSMLSLYRIEPVFQKIQQSKYPVLELSLSNDIGRCNACMCANDIG